MCGGWEGLIVGNIPNLNRMKYKFMYTICMCMRMYIRWTNSYSTCIYYTCILFSVLVRCVCAAHSTHHVIKGQLVWGKGQLLRVEGQLVRG
jgi:hypothetical protein